MKNSQLKSCPADMALARGAILLCGVQQELRLYEAYGKPGGDVTAAGLARRKSRIKPSIEKRGHSATSAHITSMERFFKAVLT